MKTRIYSAALLAVLGLSLNSCKRHGNDDDQYVTIKDGIIGCTENVNKKIVAAIDPIGATEFAYTPVVSDGIVIGPATISTDNLFYYTGDAEHDLKKNWLNEINTLNGKVVRKFNISEPYFCLVYDEPGYRLLGLTYDNELMEVDLNTGQENMLGPVVINEGIAAGTEFIRNGKLCIMGLNVMITIDPSSQAVSKIYGFNMQWNSCGYDASKDKLYYIGTPGGTQGMTLFEYDFASGQHLQLKNFPDLNSSATLASIYNAYTGQYHFYSSTDQRVSIDVNVLTYKVEKVDYYLYNTELIRGRFKIPKKEIKD